jgi:predicted nuclease with TOPRIM domain
MLTDKEKTVYDLEYRDYIDMDKDELINKIFGNYQYSLVDYSFIKESILLCFENNGVDELKKEISSLQEEVERLESKIEEAKEALD